MNVPTATCPSGRFHLLPTAYSPLFVRFQFFTADVFTDQIFGGNPLAVFPRAEGIPEEALQRIALEFNLSETVFVYPPGNPAHTRRLRIFTPAAELPFAGHPTVGAAYVLATLGDVALVGEETRITFEEGVGPVPVLIRARGGMPVYSQLSAAKMPEIGPPPPSRAMLADLLSLDATDILGGVSSPQAISCGIPFLLVPLRDRNAVKKARVRLDLWESTLKKYWAPEIMVFSRDSAVEGPDVRARVFVPGLGIAEDPATGSAAAALGGYLGTRESVPDGSFRYVVEQGVEMGRPSILEIEVDKSGGEITAIRVGGRSVMVSEGWIETGSRQ